jgi:hypothetical protein
MCSPIAAVHSTKPLSPWRAGGMNPIAPPHPDDRVDPAWYALALRAAFRTDRAAGVLEDYEFRTEDRTFHLCVRDGHVEARQGPAPAPALALVLATSVRRFLAILTGQARPTADELTGDEAAFDRLLAAFALLPATNQRGQFPASSTSAGT